MITRALNVFDPAVLTVSRITAGNTSNVIPDIAELEGTIRAFSEHTRATVHQETRRVCEHVAAAHGCTATVTIENGYPVTVNDSEVTPQVLELAREYPGRWRSSAPAHRATTRTPRRSTTPAGRCSTSRRWCTG
jgi:hippurate hydrolase